MRNEIKEKMIIKTTDLSNILKTAFKEEKLEYDSIHPKYNSRTDKNDDENIFVTCYVEKIKPYGVHIDNRLEQDKWVIDIVIMKPKVTEKIEDILKSNNYDVIPYGDECHNEFAGHRKIKELGKDISLNEIKELNIKLLRLFK